MLRVAPVRSCASGLGAMLGGLDGTFILALIGTVTGVSSLILEAGKAVANRSRLRLNFGVDTAVGKAPHAWIEVFNDAPRGTTVREVGFFAHPLNVEVVGWAGAAPNSFTFSKEPFFLEAGAHKRFEGTPDIFNTQTHADFPLRAYARDVRSRAIWGDAAPVARMVLGPDPPIAPDDPEEMKVLLAPAKSRLLPARVEPRWKVWKRRELRKPSAYRELDRLKRPRRGPVAIAGRVSQPK